MRFLLIVHWEGQGRRRVSSGPTWTTKQVQGQPGIHIKTLTHKVFLLAIAVCKYFREIKTGLVSPPNSYPSGTHECGLTGM